ncbi:MAG: hypothetical protein JXB24_06225 [Bacteroidales bacterium]|nr:hypothetical protein [Bacteroidales bacterium]
MIQIYSYSEFISRMTVFEKAYLLLFKKGKENSDCAFTNIQSAEAKVKDVQIYYADVNSVRDIHIKYELSTVPVLLKFSKGELINVVKGCNDTSHYKALFEENLPRAERQRNIFYFDIDLSRDHRAAEELVKRSGQMAVHQTDINGEIMSALIKSG